MLPEIDLVLEQSDATGLYGGTRYPLAYNYVFDWARLEHVAEKRNENLEMLLTRYVASGFYRKALKHPALIWYAPANDGIVLSVSDYGHRIRCPWLAKIPGFVVRQEGPVLRNGAPVFYWDKKGLYRLHLRSSKEESDYYVEDWGSFYGLSAEGTDQDTYDRIRRHVATHFDYSVVPKQSRQQLLVRGKAQIIVHRFVRPGGCSG